MTPVIAVDDHAFEEHASKRGIDREIATLPWRRDERKAQADRQRRQHHRCIAESREPAAREKGAEKGIVRILETKHPELARPDHKRMIEREQQPKEISAEPKTRRARWDR